MKLTIAILSCKQQLFDSAVWHAIHYANETVHVVGLGNGIALRHFDESDRANLGLDRHARTVLSLPYQDNTYHVESSEQNVGVPAGLHRLWKMARTDDDPDNHFIAFLHDDLRVIERGWDVRVKQAFKRDPSVALVGFAGTTGLGAQNQSTFSLSVISRDGGMLSNLHMHAEWHGRRVTEDQEVAFLDGFALILRQSFLDEIEGWSWWPFEAVHHAYDAGIACMVRRHQRKTWLCPVKCDHGAPDTITHARHSGSPDAYRELVAERGGHAAVHEASSRFVWEEFSDVLPFKVGQTQPIVYTPPTLPTPNLMPQPPLSASSPPTKHVRRKAAQSATRRTSFKRRYGAK